MDTIMTMTIAAIRNKSVTARTKVETFQTMFADATEHAINGQQSVEYVVWAACTLGGRKQTEVAEFLPVTSKQVNNYVAHVAMWEDLGMLPESIGAAWSKTTGSRGWFSKRNTPEYKGEGGVREQVRAATTQARKVAILTGTDVPESAPRKPAGIADAIRMLTAARDLLVTLDVSATDASIVGTLTGEIDAATAAPARALVAA